MTKTNTTIHGKVVPHVEGFSMLDDGGAYIYFVCGHSRLLSKSEVDGQLANQCVPVCLARRCDGTAKVKTPHICPARKRSECDPLHTVYACTLAHGHLGDCDWTLLAPTSTDNARLAEAINARDYYKLLWDGRLILAALKDKDILSGKLGAAEKTIADLTQRNKNLDQALRATEDKNASYKLLRDMEQTERTHGWQWGDSEIEARKSQDYPILHSEPFYAKVRSIVRAMLREPKV